MKETQQQCCWIVVARAAGHEQQIKRLHPGTEGTRGNESWVCPKALGEKNMRIKVLSFSLFYYIVMFSTRFMYLQTHERVAMIMRWAESHCTAK